jgi:hypothetical protein
LNKSETKKGVETHSGGGFEKIALWSRCYSWLFWKYLPLCPLENKTPADCLMTLTAWRG